MQSCMSDVNAWATGNMLRFNIMTELILVTLRRTRHLHNITTAITIGSGQIPLIQSVKIFGFTLDCYLTMNKHASTLAWICYFELIHLASICRFLTFKITTFVSCQSKKHLQNSLFVLPLSQRYCAVICR